MRFACPVRADFNDFFTAAAISFSCSWVAYCLRNSGNSATFTKHSGQSHTRCNSGHAISRHNRKRIGTHPSILASRSANFISTDETAVFVISPIRSNSCIATMQKMKEQSTRHRVGRVPCKQCRHDTCSVTDSAEAEHSNYR